MKKIIDGLLYDTDAAKLVKTSEWKDFGYMGDWIGADRLLFYKTPNDRFFWVYQQRQVGGCSWPCHRRRHVSAGEAR